MKYVVTIEKATRGKPAVEISFNDFNSARNCACDMIECAYPNAYFWKQTSWVEPHGMTWYRPSIKQHAHTSIMYTVIINGKTCTKSKTIREEKE